MNILNYIIKFEIYFSNLLMEIETQKVLEDNSGIKHFKFRKYYPRNIPYYILIIIIIINIGIYILFFKKYQNIIQSFSSNKMYLKINNDLNQKQIKIENIEEMLKKFDEKIQRLDGKNNTNLNKNINKIILGREFNQRINDKYIQAQKFFCRNEKNFYNKDFENKIQLSKVNFDNYNCNMFIYKSGDVISNDIINTKSWELTETNNIKNALNYYSNKKNITNDNIYIMDIGANIGWYTFILGKFGYNIISFEPSKLNYYILKKNYCLNKNDNIILNKGLFTEDKKCYLYNDKNNIGNGMIICDKKANRPESFIITEEIILTKLSNYISFLSKKNFALIKIDVEGAEEKVFEGGIDLITKIHVPFIFLEFTPSLLIMHGTKPRLFLQMFIDNGYKISNSSFFPDIYNSIEDIIRTTEKQCNLYFIHSGIIEKEE